MEDTLLLLALITATAVGMAVSTAVLTDAGWSTFRLVLTVLMAVACAGGVAGRMALRRAWTREQFEHGLACAVPACHRSPGRVCPERYARTRTGVLGIAVVGGAAAAVYLLARAWWGDLGTFDAVVGGAVLAGPVLVSLPFLPVALLWDVSTHHTRSCRRFTVLRAPVEAVLILTTRPGTS